MPRRFLAPHLPAPGERVTLSAEVSHHLLIVTRVPRGERVWLFDGEGYECEAELVDHVDRRAVLEGRGPRRPASTDEPVVLLLALTRKPAWELALRMATELGATELRPFIGERSVAKRAHPERWQRILEGAARQSGRGAWPALRELAPLTTQLSGLSDLGELRCLALTPESPARPLTPSGQGVALLLGPEGGLTDKELRLAESAGFVRAGLGPLTLRADTACAAALARYSPLTTP